MRGRGFGLPLALAIVATVKLVLLGAGLRGAHATPTEVALPATSAATSPGALSAVREASAAEAPAAADKTDRSEHAKAGSRVEATGKVGELLDAISRRQAELDAREQELANREDRLKALEKDVTTKVASLEDIEKRLTNQSKATAAASDAAAESLAKIYGGMKPAEAAPILEHLDDATLLRLIGRMKEKQVGEVLPLMTRDKAIMITRALADRHLAKP
jgi:flagellar motility protein MotE (MotC chaperone)